jgi:hypothetical protein
LDLTALQQQLALLGAPNIVPPEMNNTEDNNQGEKKWTRKEQSMNVHRVKPYMEVDEMNPEYKYPNLGMPWNY